MSIRSTWEYYDKRSLQRPPGVDNAVVYWQGRGVACTTEDVTAEADEVVAHLRSLPPASFLDAGCGPGTFTGMLAGSGVALDQSANALQRVALEHPHAAPVRGDAMALPFAGGSFARALVSHLYGLLRGGEAADLLSELRRVSGDVVIVDAGRPRGVASEELQERTLPDGSRHTVFRRHFFATELAEEVGGTVDYAGRFYVIVRVAGLNAPVVHRRVPNV